MLSGFQNASRVPELRRRLLFTLAMLAVYRLGVHVPTPGIDRQAMAAFFDQQKSTLFGFLNLFSGGALETFSVFSLGIMPYISASIILQLLTVVFPYLERLSKEGEAGRRKITQYTRYGTVVLSIVQGIMISVGLEGTQGPGGHSLVLNSRLGISHYDCDHPHLGNRVHHVARRANDRARHRQRHFFDNFRGHRRTLAIGGFDDVEFMREWRAGTFGCFGDSGFERGCGRRDYLRRARPTANSSAIRQARRGPQNVWRHDLTFTAQNQYRERYSTDFCLVDFDFSGDPGAVRQLSFGTDCFQDALAPGSVLHDLVYIILIIFFAFFYTAVVFNPSRCGREHEKVWRLYSGNSSRAKNRRIYRARAFADYFERRDLFVHCFAAADDVGSPVQCAFLFWRHGFVDRGRRGVGYCGANGNASDHRATTKVL